MSSLFDDDRHEPIDAHTGVPAHEIRRLHRGADPATSRQAAAEIVADGTVRRGCLKAFHALLAHPGLTSNEVEAAAGGVNGSIRKRLNDLWRDGWARKSKHRLCSITGRQAATWFASTPDKGKRLVTFDKESE